MEDILRKLQEYQIAAFQKGISYNINLYINEKDTDITVNMSYVTTGDTLETRTFCTTFSNNTKDVFSKMRLGRINKFINDTDKQE